MKNKEKYAEEIMEIALSGYSVAVINGKPARCGATNTDCKLCIGNKPGYCNREKVIEWAESEYVEPSVDWSNVPVDTKILVSEDSELWYRRYFSEFKNGKVYAFFNGSTSWNSADGDTAWKYAKLADE